MPAFGSLGVGGLAAFVIGSIILFDNSGSGLQVAFPGVAGMPPAGALVIVTIVWVAGAGRRPPRRPGVEGMIGALVEVTGDFPDQGVVRYRGELWNARTSS